MKRKLFYLLAGFLSLRGSSASAQATIQISGGNNAANPVINKNIYGHFAEHLGHCIYDGFYVGDTSSIPNTNGVRNDIIDALKKYPEWIAITNTIRFSGFGISIEQVNTKMPVINNTTNYYAILEIDSVLANKIIKIRDKYIDAERKYKALRDKIEIALNSLRTFAQVEKHLPEALPFLPKSSSMELVVNFDKLREEIKAA